MTTKISWKSRFLALLAAAVLIGAVARAADETAVRPGPPAGQLLIASAAIHDPRFYHAVVLLLRHDDKGAFGIVINRPLGEKPIADVLKDADAAGGTSGNEDERTQHDAAIKGTIRVFLGGPVEPQYGFVVHSADYRRGDTLMVTDGLAMTASKDVLRDIGNRKGPAKYLFALGYAGWATGQLESEVARRDWFTVPATPDLVFDVERSQVWDKALARRTREL